MKIKKALALISTAMIMTSFATGCGSSSGYDSSQDALIGFHECLIEGDIEGVLNASAPEEFWDYLVKDTGLTREKLFFDLTGSDEKEMKAALLIIHESMEENDSTIKDTLQIESKSKVDNEVYRWFNKCLHGTGIEENAEDIYYVETNIYDGILYQIDGNWYFGAEDIMEDAMEMVDIED